MDSAAGPAAHTDSGAAADSARDGGVDTAPSTGNGNETPDYGPLSPYELCVARARLRCAKWAECCGVPDAVATCEAVQVGRCNPDVMLDGWDADAAGRCAELEAASWTQCARRTDDPETLAAIEACDGPPYLPGPGEYCAVGSLGECEQLPDLSVWCDARTDGVGSLVCELGNPRAAEGGRCDERTTCRDGLRCLEGTCVPLLTNGQECTQHRDCRSGYCSGTCSASGVPVASARECTELGLLHEHALVAGNLGRPAAVAVGDAYVYWIENFAIHRVAKRGGARERLTGDIDALAETGIYARGLSVDDSHVYFAGQNVVGRVAKNGGSPEIVLLPEGRSAWEIAGDSKQQYFAPSNCRFIGVLDGGLQNPAFVDLPGADGPASYLFVDDTHVLCASGTQIHVMDRQTLEVRLLVDSAYQVGPMHADGSVVHWINADHSGGDPDRHLMRIDEAGGSEEIVVTTEVVVRRMHYDDARNLFFFGRDDRVDVFDPTVLTIEPLIEGLDTRMLLAWDADALYWTMGSGVIRVEKP